ncbi:MAG: hypothetical protein B7Y80_20745 [Hyphomicrobium sp. 32-62-53]|jgi:hypothetical protein|nr:MAG: hypothetical protein B7Z29_20695 [Hyphomicrobium sp. 12-62-95]OYX97148.1 MAG: hypothetical protein B7Y80_20745 [Hyphomicrobium sp. 32-62-53]
MQKPFREIALPLLAGGYSPTPIVPGTKRPALAEWQRHCEALLSPHDIEGVARWPIAFEGCGLVHEGGRESVLDTIASGLAKSSADTLTGLGVRHG